jgi:multidrug efflux system outer membrane protein
VDRRFSTAPVACVVLAALLTVCVAGCKVGPDYKRPDPATVKDFRGQVGPSEANSLADLPWWKVFNDKVLQGLITQALNGNYDLQTAVARIEEASAQMGIAKSELYPQVNYQGFASRQEEFYPVPHASGNLTFNTFGAVLNATWELDVWGRIRRSTEAARANLFAQEDVRRGVMLSLVSNVAAGYFLLIELDRELAIAQESANAFKQSLDLFTMRYQAGRDSKLGVVRAQAAYDSSRANIAALQRAIAQQENALSVLLGAYPGPIGRGIGLSDQVAPDTPLGLTTDVLERRPDILQAEQVMIGANAEIGVAVANYFPRIGLSALFGGEGQHVEDIVDSDFRVWHIGGALTGPIFQGGRLQASYHAQQAFWDESIAQYKKTIITAFRETSDALAAQQTLVGQREALESQIRALREAVDLAMARYNDGRSSYFEVLEAQQQLYPTESALAQTQRDQLVAVVNLYKALGGGWNLKDADWAHPD